MCIGGHGSVSGALGTSDEYIVTLRKVRAQLVNADADVQAKIGGNLLVAAASAVEFVPRIPDKFDQVFLHEVMNIFSFGVFMKRWGSSRPLSNLFQSLENRNELTRRQDACIRQRASMGAARSQFVN